MLDLVEEIVKTSPDDSYEMGMYAQFKKIDEKWGLKFYDEMYMRDKTYELQEAAHEIGCAPALGDKFELTAPNGVRVYGYITECIVKTAKEVFNERYGRSSHYMVYEEDLESMPEFIELVEELKSVMTVRDLHGSNVGVMEDGRFVVIDFSHCESESYFDSDDYE